MEEIDTAFIITNLNVLSMSSIFGYTLPNLSRQTIEASSNVASDISNGYQWGEGVVAR
jgi:hypothetical protein